MIGVSTIAAPKTAPATRAGHRRAALVVGVETYRNARRLHNPVRDSRAVKTALRLLGFDVTMKLDPSKGELCAALEAFARAQRGADVVLVYFAGHGVQIGGRNFLLPADVETGSSASLQASALALDEMMARIAQIAPRRIVLLDACRNDPLASAERAGTRGLTVCDDADAAVVAPGLGRIGRADGALYAFSTAPGAVAADGAARHSPFAEALVTHLAKPNLDFGAMLKLVQMDVYERTAGQQIPYIEDALPNLFFANARGMPSISSLKDVNVHVGDFFAGGIGKSLAYLNGALDEPGLRRLGGADGCISAGKLKELLKGANAPRQPMPVTVSGVFFPSALLSFGWWERGAAAVNDNVAWRDPALQSWLFRGFEQWAPSWDVNDWSHHKPLTLVGQIGQNDEADSIPVLIKSRRAAKRLRDDLDRRSVANARVTGILCHESQLLLEGFGRRDAAFLEAIRELTSSQFYIVLQEGEPAHHVELSTESVDFYSGYVWQCWAPQEWIAKDAYDTRLPSAYFVWEHTNLADGDVVQYALDSMAAKLRFLRRRLQRSLALSGELVLLQHLMPADRLGAEAAHPRPAISTEQFRLLFGPQDVPIAA